MAISRAQLLKELLPGLNGLFGLEYKRYGQEFKEIYETESSSKAFEEEQKLGGFGAAPVKTEGSAIEYDEARESYTARYNHETVAMGFAITQEAVEDHLYDSLAARYTKALARAMAYTKEVKGASLLNEGFNGSVTYGDGKPLLSTDHPLLNGGVNANKPTVDTDLNETSLEAAFIQIGEWTDERGLLIAARPRKLVIPSSMIFTARRLLESQLRPGTADNDINALKSEGVVPQGFTVNHFLSDPDAWFILTDVPNGLKHFNRVALKTSMEDDFDTGNAKYKARERYSFGCSDPLGIWGSSGG